MPAVAADLSISTRWILPMTSREVLLEDHTLVVRNGRILDILPSDQAAQRYASAAHVDRPGHLLLPGLVNSRTQIAPHAAAAADPRHICDSALLGIAAMLRAGTSCFCAMGYFPQESATAAATQGMRAVIGIPLSEAASPWARQAADYLTRALRFRDEFAGHPDLATAFAPHDVAAIGDAMFGRIATLANELDAGLLMSLHESAADVAECVAQHGLRPIARLHALGLLTPALTAANMVHVDDEDMAMAQRSGIAVTLCPGANLSSGHGPPAVAAWARTGLRLGLGTGSASAATAPDLWGEMKLLALLAQPQQAAGAGDGAALDAWGVLASATRGAAAALGLDHEIGTLEAGKWADLCCVDLRTPALLRAAAAPVTALVFAGGRDDVSDVWVSGRHLLADGAFTRLDWDALTARLKLSTTIDERSTR